MIVLVHGYTNCPAQYSALAPLLFEQGSNILLVPLPHHGLADLMNEEQSRLSAGEIAAYADQVVDIANGLGDQVVMVGISLGGVTTAWAAQNRADIYRAVVISPAFGFKVVPGPLTRLASRTFSLLPNMYIWNEPQLEADSLPAHNYPRISTRALAQILRLSLATQGLMRQKSPAAGSILVITNLDDQGVDNGAIGKVVDLWRLHGAAVETYQFPADLHLPHGLIDPQEPGQNIAVVYPRLLELIDR